MTTSKEDPLKPLQNVLQSILTRLEALETKAGVPVGSSPSFSSSSASNDVLSSSDEEPPSVTAFDSHTKEAVKPFIDACNAIPGLKDTGSSITQIWQGMREIIIIGTKCKKPANVQNALVPFLKPISDGVSKINKSQLDRKYDWHVKAMMEMLNCASWVIMAPPPAPCNFIKELAGSIDFWANKIRKEYKGKDDKEIRFCDTIKNVVLNLSAYVKEYHLSGLMWNPHGIPIENYSSEEKPKETTATKPSSSSNNNNNKIDVSAELKSKLTLDGSSAATGLRKVTREQQTWRKEYKNNTVIPVPSTVKPSQIKAIEKNASLIKEPICKLQAQYSKWIVENQTSSSNPNGLCVVEVTNPREQVYIFNCEGATIQIKGKVKSVILDSCKKTNLLFETAISSCEIVNCFKVQLQSTGVCPSFSIDKTDGCLIYLSAEAVSTSNFVSSKSTEMNVSWPDEKSGEQKEAAIPEQFVHRLVDGVITSSVSDIYH